MTIVKNVCWLTLVVLLVSSLMPVQIVRAQSITTADLVGAWTTRMEVVNVETYGRPGLTAGQIQDYAKFPQRLTFSVSGSNLYLTPSQPPVPQIPLTLSGNEFNANHIRKIGDETYTVVVYGRATKRGNAIDLTVIISGSIVHDNQDDVIVFYYSHTANTASRTVSVTTSTVAPVDAISGTEVGRVSFVQGKAHIQRSSRIISAVVGEGIMAGDTLVSENGELNVVVDGITYKILPGTRFRIPERVQEVKTSYIQSVLKEYWEKTKQFLAGQSFEVKTPGGGPGVRG